MRFTKCLYQQEALSEKLASAGRMAQISRNAGKVWRNVSVDNKRSILFKAAQILEREKEAVAKTMESETGTPLFFGEKFLADAIGYLKEMGTLLATRPPMIVPQMPGNENSGFRQAFVFKEPIGTVLSIAPWNAAAVLAIRSVACPLAAGCPVIFKSSPLAQKSQEHVLQVFKEAGLPDGVLQIIHADESSTPSVVQALIADPVVRKINFTGSYAVGRLLAIEAAKHVKPVLLELGGKGAVLVDCDKLMEPQYKNLLEEAATNIVIGGWANGGQICMSTERVLLFGSPSACEGVQNAIGTTAAHLQKAPFLQARQITQAAAEKIRDMVSDALNKGAELGAGSEAVGLTHSHASTPKVWLTNVKKGMRIYGEETFGPVFWVGQVSTVNEAIEIANSSEYGLNSAIWTPDVKQAMEYSARLESGAVHINGNTVYDHGCTPHGGVKASGFGRFGGNWGIDEFCTVKCVTVA